MFMTPHAEPALVARSAVRARSAHLTRIRRAPSLGVVKRGARLKAQQVVPRDGPVAVVGTWVWALRVGGGMPSKARERLERLLAELNTSALGGADAGVGAATNASAAGTSLLSAAADTSEDAGANFEFSDLSSISTPSASGSEDGEARALSPPTPTPARPLSRRRD